MQAEGEKVHRTHLVDGGGGERMNYILQAEHTPVPDPALNEAMHQHHPQPTPYVNACSYQFIRKRKAKNEIEEKIKIKISRRYI